MGGLLVFAVDPAGPGAQAGIASGDVLLEVQKKEIPDVAAFLEAVEGRRSAMVRFWRGEGLSYAAVGGLRQEAEEGSDSP